MRRSFVFTALCLVSIVSPVAAKPDKQGAYVLTKPRRTLKQIEKIYSEMPPLKYTPSKDRWKFLPKTASILKAKKGELRVVMLGDSIVNDTSRSSWDLLVQKQYPKHRITKITCVRGSTGCWWYKKPERVRRYVLDQKPDLLIIGGISQRNDIDSIRSVIQQVRAKRKCDVLLMSGSFGRVDPKNDKQWQFEFDPKGKTYRAKLLRLAKETNSAFLDMRAHWGKYVRESGKDVKYFMRDVVHANPKGEQIIGRILARHLTLDEG